ncbi:MAG: hypothetical protein AAB669_01255 [Patescibacteria group bacterium]
MAKNEKTGKKPGTIASELLRSKAIPKRIKTVAASDLTQRPDKRKMIRKK